MNPSIIPVLDDVELLKVAGVVGDLEGLHGAAVDAAGVPRDDHVLVGVEVDVDRAPRLLPRLHCRQV